MTDDNQQDPSTEADVTRWIAQLKPGASPENDDNDESLYAAYAALMRIPVTPHRY